MPDPSIPQPIDIMNVPVTPFDSHEHVASYVARAINTTTKSFCVAINPEKIYRAQHEPELMQQLQLAEMHICDGVGAAIAARILHGVKLTRITGVELFLHLIEVAATRGWKVFLLGASPESNQAACDALLKQHPKLHIVGHRDGYFDNAEEVVEQINQSGAQMLFVAFGSPRQEQWIIENRDRLNVSFFMGIGGSLDVVSDRARRAPLVVRRVGLEWLFRLACQPSRWRRQLALSKFLYAVIQQKTTREVFLPRVAKGTQKGTQNSG